MNTTSHHTTLPSHFKTAHFWFDIVVLCMIWVAALWVDAGLRLMDFISVALILKLVGLIGLLEVVGFFVLHSLGVKRGLLAQGLIGGFISSTAVFVRLTAKPMREAISSRRLARALLLAVLSMLFECLIILYTFVPQQILTYGWPIGLTMLVIGLTVWLLPNNPQESTQSSILEKSFEHPVVWLRVMRFSLVIVVLMWLIRFLNDSLHLPILWSTFLLASFEAHAVLAATLLNLSESQVNTGQLGLWLVIMVSLGNTVSKSILVLRTGNRALYLYVISPLMASVAASVLIAWLMASY